MDRLIVTNSALAYPPPPPSLVGPGDEVLPLVETFEEALFMPSEFYDELYSDMPELNRTARALARRISDLLPPAIGRPRPEWGHSPWEVFADSFVKFSLGPLMANSRLAQRAAGSKPQEVFAWDEPGHVSWWSGRQMVAEIAHDIARAAGARLRLRSRAPRRLTMKLAQVPMAYTRALVSFLKRLRRPVDTAPGQFDVIFILVGPTLSPIFERVGKTLGQQHGLRVLGVEVPLVPSVTGFIRGEMPHTSLYACSSPAMIAAANLDILASCSRHAHFLKAMRHSDELTDLPIGARSVLVRRMHSALICDLPMALYHSRLWQQLLDAVQPAAIVSFNTYNEAIAPGILQARARGIPTVCCQHGIWGPSFLAGTLLPYDELAVFGQYARELLSPIAHPHTQFSITGHSLYDYHALTQQPVSPRKGAQPVVLATTQPIEHRLRPTEPRWWLTALADACAELGAHLVIKPHPQESDTGIYRDLVQRRPQMVTFVPHGERPLEDLIAECDVLVTRFSTTAMEGNLQHKPVLTVSPSGGRDRYPYAEDGGALGVYSCEQILPALRKLLTDDGTRERLASTRNQFIERHVGPVDGKATERIAAVIAKRAGEAPVS